jgi:hypothetical protein
MLDRQIHKPAMRCLCGSAIIFAACQTVGAQWDPTPLCSVKITLHQTTDPGLGFCETSYKRCDSDYSCDPGTMYSTCGDRVLVDGYCQMLTGGWTDPDTGECEYGTPSGRPTLYPWPVFGYTGMTSFGGIH